MFRGNAGPRRGNGDLHHAETLPLYSFGNSPISIEYNPSAHDLHGFLYDLHAAELISSEALRSRRIQEAATLLVDLRTMAAPSMSVSMANHWNSWFNFHSGKQASSTLLEANVAAQSAGMDGCVPGEADGQSNDGQSISGASRLSAASTTSPFRASFADQQQQPLEQMCAHSATPHLPYLAPPRFASF